LLPERVFGKPLLTAPVQFVAAEKMVSVNAAVAPVGATSNLTFPSVKVVVAVPERPPVAVTVYWAVKVVGRTTSSAMFPEVSAVTSSVWLHELPTLSFVTMWTDSPGCQSPPVRWTVEPGA
jgi:hypothetical protein